MSNIKRHDGKKIFINIVTVFFLFLIVLMFSYGCYIVNLLSPVPPTREELAGRMYGNVNEDVFLLLESDRFVLSVEGEEKTFLSSEYVDGIITLNELVDEGTEEEQEILYTFLFLEGDRIFYKEKNVYMELVWISIVK